MIDTSTPLAGIGGTLRSMAGQLRVSARWAAEELSADQELVARRRAERARELEELEAENRRLKIKLAAFEEGRRPPGVV